TLPNPFSRSFRTIGARNNFPATISNLRYFSTYTYTLSIRSTKAKFRIYETLPRLLVSSRETTAEEYKERETKGKKANVLVQRPCRLVRAPPPLTLEFILPRKLLSRPYSSRSNRSSRSRRPDRT
ncbi:hypothetical protein ALC57_16759, partial [Trachymyrmex cornetzi]